MNEGLIHGAASRQTSDVEMYAQKLSGELDPAKGTESFATSVAVYQSTRRNVPEYYLKSVKVKTGFKVIGSD
jgi:hypothetical protein